MPNKPSYLEELEAAAIYVMREVAAQFDRAIRLRDGRLVAAEG